MGVLCENHVGMKVLRNVFVNKLIIKFQYI